MQGFLRQYFLITCVNCVSLFIGCQVEATYNDDEVINLEKELLEVWHPRKPRLAYKTNDLLECEKPSLYICEEPPDIVSPEATKSCNYRNVQYHEQVYRWVAGRGCLMYTPDFLYVDGVNNINLNAGCFYGNWFAPCLEIAKEDGTCGCYPFDPGLEEVANYVREAILPSAHGRWENCFYAARECCSHYMLEDVNASDTSQCQATFDGWTCWQSTPSDTLAQEVCSEFAYSSVGPSCNHFSSKHCDVNGTWELQTDYSTCSITPRLLRRYHFYIAILAFSIASCLPAVFIFFFYKRLRITRVALHRNLLIVVIIRNVLVIISRSVVYIDELTSSGETVMSTHSLACRFLAIAEKTAANAVFVCMLVEGIYLHRLIVAVFRKKVNVNWLYGIGACIAILPVIAWASVMAVLDNHSCWVVYTVEHVQWILDAPRIAVLVVNLGLFADVLRVLLTKIRNAENSNQLSTVKATLFLMPIFGTQFLLTLFRPSTDNCTAEQIYYYFSYTVEGLQGFIVALIYCYINKEVHNLIKATYKKTEQAVVSRVRRDSAYPGASVTDNSSNRRMTYSTALPNNDDKNLYAAVKPKLHVAEIISIQASERLAEILDPVYETIENGITNESYDALERSDFDNDSGFIPNRNSRVEDYYGFTNASSVSIDCHDWIRCVSSPSSSVYDNSLTEFEARYLERKFPNYRRKSSNDNQISVAEYDNVCNKDEIGDNIIEEEKTTDEYTTGSIADSEYEDCEDMLEEIMQYIASNEIRPLPSLPPPPPPPLSSDLLSPNRQDQDKIVFVDE